MNKKMKIYMSTLALSTIFFSLHPMQKYFQNIYAKYWQQKTESSWFDWVNQWPHVGAEPDKNTINEPSPFSQKTPLQYAIILGKYDAANQLLKIGADANAQTGGSYDIALGYAFEAIYKNPTVTTYKHFQELITNLIDKLEFKDNKYTKIYKEWFQKNNIEAKNYINDSLAIYFVLRNLAPILKYEDLKTFQDYVGDFQNDTDLALNKLIILYQICIHDQDLEKLVTDNQKNNPKLGSFLRDLFLKIFAKGKTTQE